LEVRVRDASDSTTEDTADHGGALGSPPWSAVPSVVRSNGTGLSATARRLQLLYGDDHTMRAGPTADGWEVVLRVPARAGVPNAEREEAFA